MKKYFCIFLALLLCFSLTAFADENTDTTIQPRSSHVFDSVGSGIGKSEYEGDCTLVDKGSGTVTIRLQKYSSSSSSWTTVDGPYSKTFSNRDLCGYSKSKVLSKGKYRCRTDVTATVGSYTDSRTVYSSTLTIN